MNESITKEHFYSFKPEKPTFDTVIEFLQKQKEDSAKKDAEIEKLRYEIALLKEEVTMWKGKHKDASDELTTANWELENVKTEDQFVERLLTEAKELFASEPEKATPVAQVLRDLGKKSEATILNAWIKAEKKALAGGLIVNGPLNDIHDNENVKAGL